MLLEIENKPFIQFILILSLCFISTLVFSVIGLLGSALMYNINPLEINNLASPTMIEAMKMVQLFSAIGLFVTPPIIYGWISLKNPFQKLGLKTYPKAINYGLIITFMIVFSPFLSLIIELNSQMVLPDFMSGLERWMRESEQNAEAMTRAFLSFNGLGSLIYVLIIVAVVPALGEELLFRAVLQKIFINWSKNIHLGIWISAILFSALHLQFFGFFPRFLLGLLFGYIFYWSGSLWLPILGHFINNGAVVVLSYFNPEMLSESEIIFEEGALSFLMYAGSFIFSLIVLYLLWKQRINQPKEQLE